jgi:predicted mannosyl-3-phosphoglycerate phosphatase (HAD superfamily)
MLPVILATIAPILAKQGLDLLAGAFRGAGTAAAEKVTELVKEQTGIDIATKPELGADDVAKLRQFEANNAAFLSYYAALDSNDVERERIAQKDRESARLAQQAALQSSDRMAQQFIYWYASAITLLTFTFVFYAAFWHNYAASPGSEQIINTVLGFLLGTAFSAIVQYYFGSSIGSKRAAERLQSVVQDLEAK